ncbi:hypothetical protein DEFDS_P156 (plasmid) [Deferribacter desulfuricans SSM1]|uniref:Uncharacterized protein n=1 Tax=Deferribacter desulfuricans (strain DSM 14783 / JCM 11476 / NBRC 101012 / SSM1) TaxID=639282 RepID=D3PEY5_DEFDS|nr:hypothetical protein [Deferribacter desulfuricans]BAI81777.1 hypothetical protein DEFDS_P156 [Deferribacter desulfuricans SSM1]
MLFNKIFKRIEKGYTFTQYDILRIADKEGWTIAHEQVNKGWITGNLKLLKIADKHGWTVAHEQAINKRVTDRIEVLKITDIYGYTVAEKQADFSGYLPNIKHILTTTNEKGLPLALYLYNSSVKLLKDVKKSFLKSEYYETYPEKITNILLNKITFYDKLNKAISRYFVQTNVC